MSRKLGSLWLLVICITLISAAAVTAQDELPPVRIGFVLDGPWELNDPIAFQFRKEIEDILAGEFLVSFPEDGFLVGDYTRSGISNAIDSLLRHPDIDMVVASGPIGSDLVCQRGELNKPVIAPFVIDPEIQGIPLKSGVSGVKNLCYLAAPLHILSEMMSFRDIVDYQHIALMPSAPLVEAVPEVKQRTTRHLRELGVEVSLVPVGNSVRETLAALPETVEAVYVGGMMHLSSIQFDSLVTGFIDRKLPSFSLLGRMDVDRGIMAGALPERFFFRTARRVALNVQRILLGEDPSEIPVSMTVEGRLVINMSTARAIGIYPPWKILTEADLIDQERSEVTRVLTLGSAVREALAANLELAAKQREIAAGAQDVNRARANLLPQLSVSGAAQIIDNDRAAASSGTQPERTYSGSAGLTQTIFSESAWAGFSAARHGQRGLEKDLESVRLDIIATAATAYLDLLRARTTEQIEKDNLRVTRSNLDLARVRRTIGTADQSEVLRWESQIATNRKSVIRANSNRNLAEMELNRLLHRPLEESFKTEEPTINDVDLLSSDDRIYEYMSNPWSFRRFREFMANEAELRSPELAQLDAAVAAQSRLRKSAKLAYWLPTVAFKGDITKVFSTEGAGSTRIPMVGVESPDDVNWTVGFQASLPLFEGGNLRATSKQATEQLSQLELERRAVAERIGQRMRSALHRAGASYAGIGLSDEAARAADSTLQLVVDAYSRGALSLLDVIDAQNVALTANRSAANAVYDFLLDLVEVERAMGSFELMRTQKGRDDFFNRLEHFLHEEDK